MAIQTHLAILKLADDEPKSLGVAHVTGDPVTCAEGLAENVDFAVERAAGTIRRLRPFGRELYHFSVHYDDLSEEQTAAEAARVAWRERQQAAAAGMNALPGWATYTAAEAQAAIDGAVLGGQTKAQLEAWVDANVTNIASARTALKQVGDALIDLRTLCEKLAMAVVYLRDIDVQR